MNLYVFLPTRVCINENLYEVLPRRVKIYFINTYEKLTHRYY